MNPCEKCKVKEDYMPYCDECLKQKTPFRYSINIIDLKADINMTIQLIEDGEINTDNEIEHLRGIESALHEIHLKLMGANTK